MVKGVAQFSSSATSLACLANLFERGKFLPGHDEGTGKAWKVDIGCGGGPKTPELRLSLNLGSDPIGKSGQLLSGGRQESRCVGRENAGIAMTMQAVERVNVQGPLGVENIARGRKLKATQLTGVVCQDAAAVPQKRHELDVSLGAGCILSFGVDDDADRGLASGGVFPERDIRLGIGDLIGNVHVGHDREAQRLKL